MLMKKFDASEKNIGPAGLVSSAFQALFMTVSKNRLANIDDNPKTAGGPAEARFNF
ncbi:hypothetical protein [Paraherbaspirillum soli]|uniref:Uncharacterized protein n=1 Tax=Paraherbaspirillum soli TaxID=631222 RepID=A0ABW0M5X5_9BURK